MFDYKKHFLYLGGGGGAEPEPETPNLPTPVTTKEQYLYAKVTGGDTSNLPTPVTTEEQYLYALAMNGGGVSAVTLYADSNDSPFMLYKDEALTQNFATADEAIDFLEKHPLIRVKFADGGQEGYMLPVSYEWGENEDLEAYAVSVSASGEVTFFLYIGEGPGSEIDPSSDNDWA